VAQILDLQTLLNISQIFLPPNISRKKCQPEFWYKK